MNKAILYTEVQQFIADHLREVSTNIALKKSPFADVSSKELADQIDSKQRTEKKLPLWFSTPNIYYPPRLSVEQASSEATAQYKRSLIKGETLIDLTGGFGIDSYYFAQNAQVTHVELNEELSTIAEHNAGILGAENIRFIKGDGIEYLKSTGKTFDTIYIDPSRRVKTQRVFRLSDCEPDIVSNLPFLLKKASRIIVKSAPLLDIQSGLNELTNVSAIHVLSVKNDCKEILWVIDRDFSGEPQIICSALDGRFQQFRFKQSEERAYNIAEYAHPGPFIYEPDVALLKAGCFKLLTREFKIEKLNPNTHLYTSEQYRSDFIGRKFQLIKIWEYKVFQAEKPIEKANVICRNFPLSPEEVKKKSQLKDGGEKYLFFTTGPDNNLLALQCKRL